ncbi:zinc finger protein ZOP1 isoform X2 [Amborella trichopoda]|uniref:zinc finger protein ZOP1 isoform X2 n=1 Tax=Amborella trichopoda TaxID=13333 RepID=UPI0009BE04C6|nr:zinc finger protein ZOP1 isoform X2 [Amborella trichopoda]|eukprot:XP_020517407.1 zinc finger protein ZOP1 isoform X2 [Amborella trichopoda]
MTELLEPPNKVVTLSMQSTFLSLHNLAGLVRYHHFSCITASKRTCMYWVSQGNKWCDFCKIYIANNPLSIRTHELGQRHKDNVATRLAAMRKENAAKEKEQKEALRDFEQLEMKYIPSNSSCTHLGSLYHLKANRSYQKDLAAFKKGADSNTDTLETAVDDPHTKASLITSKDDVSEKSTIKVSKDSGKYKGGPPPGLVVSSYMHSRGSSKGAPSSISVGKRKREDKPKSMSSEEAAALQAREAARRRTEEREKGLLGLYRSY